MVRPSKEEVDDALETVEHECDIQPLCGVEHSTHEALVLAAEVRALRAELSECRSQLQLFRDASEAAELRIVELRAELNEDVIVRAMHHPDGRFEIRMETDEQAEIERLQESIDLYSATVARVEALPKGWRSEASLTFSCSAMSVCAEELEAALRQP
jgi:hypothetical protein